jgi:hypothetical protein
MRRARATLLAGSLAFGGPGLGFLLAPDGFAARVDLTLGSVTARADVRAVMGGLELAIGALLAWSAIAPDRWRAGLALLIATLGGLVLGRITSLARDGAPGALGWLLFAVELALLAAAVLALARRDQAPPPP